ncbi:MAG TPA: 50S ribosomal protein L18 [Candidatus Nanoarchaeia archaeon]|nr:50S ribosomal protein L18 [Candidatus Nanoarchaeia archaeon]
MRKNYTVKYRRKRAAITDYKKRLRLLACDKDRLVIRRSNNNFVVQVVRYEAAGDKVIAMANAQDLIKLDYKGHKGNRCAAYLIGLICGKKAKEKGIRGCVLDMGIHRSIAKNSIYAALKGFLESGIEVPHKENMLPTEDMIMGRYINGRDYPSIINEIKKKIK